MKKTSIIFTVFIWFMILTFSVSASEEEWLCPSCGETVTGYFCSNCGKAKPSEEWICPSCGETATGNFCSNCGTERDGNKTDKQRLEGDGFDSPEEAIEAYIDGLKNKDIDKMVSCFAIETLLKNYDLKRFMESLSSYQPFLWNYFLPSIGEFATHLNIKRRRDTIINYIFYQYLSLMDSTQLCSGQPIPLEVDQNTPIDEFIRDNYATNDSMIDSIVFNKEYYNPELVYDNYDAEYEQLVHESYKKIYGPEEIKTIIAKFYSDDEPVLAFYEAYRYGDRWYIGRFRDGAMGYGLWPLRYDSLSSEPIFERIQ